MKLSAILLLIGVAIIGYAYSLAPYKDEALFTERYMALSDGQSTEYWKLRDEMLTPKFQVQDYGGTLVAIDTEDTKAPASAVKINVDGVDATTRRILDERVPGAFSFDDETLSWGDRSVSRARIKKVRHHAGLSFGSCSFDEPCDDLRALGLL